MILSIVVPTYNIEKYIERNIESFLNVEDELKSLFEILIINDGSTDNTLQVVTELISKIDCLNIRVINKSNGGHGSAVNRGIEEAKGKYFKIVDGDDWVKKSDFEEYLKRLEKTNVDMVVTNFSKQYTYENRVESEKVINVEDYYKSNKIPKIFPMHSVTYKTCILKENNIKLTEKIFYVDIQYIVFPLKYISDWEYWNLDVYQYFLGRPDQSMTIENRMKNIEHSRKVTESILEFYSTLGDVYFKDIVNSLLKGLLNTRYLLAFLSDDRERLLKETTDYIRKYKIKYTYDSRMKTSYLLYLNEIHNRRYSFIVYPIVGFKLNRLSKYGI